MKQALYWLFASAGWILAAYLFNTPTAPVRFVDRPAVEPTLFDTGLSRRIVEWNEGKYVVFSDGKEQVTPYWGQLTTALDPRRGWCPQEIAVLETTIYYTICHDAETLGGEQKPRNTLSAAAERVLRKGRTLAEKRWGPLPPRQAS
jgi:hypothetical protein